MRTTRYGYGTAYSTHNTWLVACVSSVVHVIHILIHVIHILIHVIHIPIIILCTHIVHYRSQEDSEGHKYVVLSADFEVVKDQKKQFAHS